MPTVFAAASMVLFSTCWMLVEFRRCPCGSHSRKFSAMIALPTVIRHVLYAAGSIATKMQSYTYVESRPAGTVATECLDCRCKKVMQLGQMHPICTLGFERLWIYAIMMFLQEQVRHAAMKHRSTGPCVSKDFHQQNTAPRLSFWHQGSVSSLAFIVAHYVCPPRPYRL
jgi:hypothetical protein